jgi:iron complex outermembrane receptor protein
LLGGGAIDLDRDYFGLDARWRWSGQWRGRPVSLVVGLEHEVADERRRGYENFLGSQFGVFGALRRDERDRVTGQDYYQQADWQPAARWRLNAGLRRSTVRFVSRDDFVRAGNPDDSGRLAYAHSSPVLGLLFHATPWLSVYANAGGGFETPTFAELAYRRDGRSGLNDGLRPARSDNVELGLRARHGARAYSAALFHSRTRDELVVLSNQGGRSVFGNAGLSRRRGLELAYAEAWSARWHLAAT